MSNGRPHNARGYLFIAPATVYLAVFALFPILAAGYLSLHRWHLLKDEHPFVGLANFGALAADPFFRTAVWNTCVYVVVSVPLGVITSLAVAVLIAQPLRGVHLFRTLYFIPAISSQVALSMVWIWILLPEVGLINTVAKRLGFDGSTNFLAQPGWAMASLVAMSLWIGLGPRMVIFLAGLKGIPESLYEAAALDGCSGWHKFRSITLPMLSPTILFVVVTTTISAFQLFTPVYVMTKGGPRRTTDVVLYHIYKEAWQKFDIGMASAMSYVLFSMIVVVALIQLKLMRGGLRGVGAD
ncbi:MAG: sugar ABC transporter permease [Planctomycetes bacterium]|nr:sugar ABC transporter permease [Planctomycetota bacterium]